MKVAASLVTRLLAMRSRLAIVGLSLAALVSLALEHGFTVPPLPVWLLVGIQAAAIVAYLASVVADIVRGPGVFAGLRAKTLDVAFVVIGVALLIGEAEFTKAHFVKLAAIYVGTIQILLVLRIVAAVVRWNLEMSSKRLHPARLLVGSFLVVIVVGGLLLALPKAVTPDVRERTADHVGERLLDSMFTSTSAACVTGLVVYDTGSEFTLFGQIVVLALIQLGGLGIMISSSLFGLLAGRQLSLHQSLVLQDELSRQTVGRMAAAIRFIVVATLLCEAVGAAICYPMFAARCSTYGETAFHCVFHSISAFCNAGFALQADSFVSYDGCWGVYVSIMPLIVIGGLGFPVLQDLWELGKARWRRWRSSPFAAMPITPESASRRPYRLELHTKIVLATSVALILCGAILLFVIESAGSVESASPGAMANMGIGKRVLGALFQSVTARTAGFNTVALDESAMSNASHFLLMVLMFVGGSPASTAGGVKTVAAAIIVLSVIATLRGRARVEAYGRTVPEDLVRRASLVFIVMGAAVATGVLLLCMTEEASFRSIAFEVVSACGTVGLSTGITPELTWVGRLIIMALMFAGRLGPLTVMIAVAGAGKPARYAYPVEQVTIS